MDSPTALARRYDAILISCRGGRTNSPAAFHSPMGGDRPTRGGASNAPAESPQAVAWYTRRRKPASNALYPVAKEGFRFAERDRATHQIRPMSRTDVTLRLCVCHQSVIRGRIELVASTGGSLLLGDSAMRALPSFLFPAAAGVALLANVNARADTPVAITYVPNSLAEATIADGPWTLHQRVGKNAHDASGILPPPGTKTPFNPPTTKYGIPYKNYCVGGRVQTARGLNPMQPYYFPFVRNNEEYLEGFFDYRPRNEQEATVAAISTDLGKSWIFKDEALGLNPYCPADPTDPDNNNVIVDGLSTPYASSPNNAADN